MSMTVRLSYYDGDEFGGCIDLPDNCTIRTAVRSLASRGWEEKSCIHGIGCDDGCNGGTVLMINSYGTRVIISNYIAEVGSSDSFLLVEQASA